jgi:glycerophosphoryl diester phosphodiesterase
MKGPALDWLKRPIAHRGLHDPRRGIIENSASAIETAIAANFAVEVDLQCASDGRPVVFHDTVLDRLTEERGLVGARDAASLSNIPLRGSKDRILCLPELLSLVGGRVPVIIEIKSTWGRDPRYAEAIAEDLSAYSGALAIMSFDHHLLAAMHRLAPSLPRGLISERFSDTGYWSKLSRLQRFAMRHLLTAAIARPDFIAYDVKALPAAAPWIARRVFQLLLLTWTVRNEADRATACRFADAMIFEDVRP